MFRGYRCFLVALVGWLSLAAQHPNQPTNSKQAEATNAAGNATGNVVTPDYEAAERARRAKSGAQCDPANEKRDSELCAQWKAADAAADAARWTYIGNWIGSVSGLLVLIALALAYQANRIARDTAKRQLRAYVNIESFSIKGQLRAGSDFPVKILLINSGQTPAHKLALHWTIGFIPADGELTLPDDDDDDGARSVSTLAAGQKLPASLSIGVRDVDIEGMDDGTSRFFILGKITYEDIFGRGWQTTFKSEMTRDCSFHICEEGNEST